MISPKYQIHFKSFLHQPLRSKSPLRKASSSQHSNVLRKKKKSRPSVKSVDYNSTEEKEIMVLSPAAMENLYYVAHSAVDALDIRGFGWKAEDQKKKKRKKGRKK